MSIADIIISQWRRDYDSERGLIDWWPNFQANEARSSAEVTRTPLLPGVREAILGDKEVPLEERVYQEVKRHLINRGVAHRGLRLAPGVLDAMLGRPSEQLPTPDEVNRR
jgi:hypothetical protein